MPEERTTTSKNTITDHKKDEVEWTYPEIGTKGLDPGPLETDDGTRGGPNVGPPTGRVLLGVLVGGAP
jgi:hypothetical protein